MLFEHVISVLNCIVILFLSKMPSNWSVLVFQYTLPSVKCVLENIFCIDCQRFLRAFKIYQIIKNMFKLIAINRVLLNRQIYHKDNVLLHLLTLVLLRYFRVKIEETCDFRSIFGKTSK